jgi:hypothetical protein
MSPRDLTTDEQATLARRRAGFAQFRAERMHVLADFAEALQLPMPPMIVAEPRRYLDAIDQFLRDQLVAPDDRVWILTRIGYFVGEILIVGHRGVWMLDEDPGSRTYLRYAIGFPGVRPGTTIDPFAHAAAYIDRPAPRSLAQVVADVEAALR